MIQRYFATCDDCQKQFLFRAVVPLARNNEFLFACPACGIRLWGSFKFDDGTHKVKVVPVGFSFGNSVKDDKSPIVTLSIDLPVHKTRHIKNLVNGGSPFLWLANNMGPAFLEWKMAVDTLHQFHHNFGASLKQCVNYGSLEQEDKIRSFLAEKIDEDLRKADATTVIYAFHKVLMSFYSVLIDLNEMAKLLDEYYQYLNDCKKNHESKYRQLLNDFRSTYGFIMFKKQVYSVYYRVINNFDSFITGLLYEKMSDQMKSDISQYRLYRNDYDAIKSLYQDIFELNAKSMLYIGSSVNLSKRNNPRQFASGTISCKKFRKMESFKKLAVLDELPLLKDFIGKVSRPMRNSIGHFSAEYEYTSGNIVFENGSKQNHIEFLGNFLWAVKSIWILLTVIEKVELDYKRLCIK